MEIESIIKENGKYAVWVAHIVVALYIYGEGKILSWKINEAFVYIILAISLYIFNKVHKDLIDIQSKPPEIKEIIREVQSKKKMPMASKYGKPFDLNLDEGDEDDNLQ